ncbi:MAG: ATP-dependent sacrificial sulfur transferase LarE [Nitrospiraceae bacterium]|nr:MAG: ATP-dependent sacrificial sulfur transferase LarE [Nitrospiraceae bacterium]
MNDITSATLYKFDKLKDTLKAMDRVIIAYSGGVDSAFLLKAASLSVPGEILAVTGISESLPEEELSFARELASSLSVKHLTIFTEELKNENYVSNPPDRCYYCKKDLFRRLRQIASDENFTCILDGTNADDANDWRPGRRAAREEEVVSPLLEAGLTKKEIRELSRNLGLSTWDKPATPCLSSRFPYGHSITAEALDRVHRAEKYLKQLGIKELRVRNHSETARIEVHPEDFGIVLNDTVREKIIAFLKSIGYKNVTLDLQGFRSGSANE